MGFVNGVGRLRPLMSITLLTTELVAANDLRTYRRCVAAAIEKFMTVREAIQRWVGSRLGVHSGSRDQSRLIRIEATVDLVKVAALAFWLIRPQLN
jgi:hypothetical protein